MTMKSLLARVKIESSKWENEDTTEMWKCYTFSSVESASSAESGHHPWQSRREAGNDDCSDGLINAEDLW